MTIHERRLQERQIVFTFSLKRKIFTQLVMESKSAIDHLTYKANAKIFCVAKSFCVGFIG